MTRFLPPGAAFRMKPLLDAAVDVDLRVDALAISKWDRKERRTSECLA